MPNRFDRRLKGSGLNPGDGVCTKKNTNNTFGIQSRSLISSNRAINRMSRNNIASQNTKISTTQNISSDINTKNILNNHKESINKLNEKINSIFESIKNNQDGHEKNFNKTYEKINHIEGFLEDITVDTSGNNIESTKNNHEIFDKKSIESKIEILQQNINDNKDYTTKAIYLNTVFIKDTIGKLKIEDLKTKLDSMGENIKNINFTLKKIVETQNHLKKMCIDNDNYIKRYKLRKEKTIQNQKNKLKADIPIISQQAMNKFDKKYEFHGVPDRLLNGLNRIKPIKELIPQMATQPINKLKNTSSKEIKKEIKEEIKKENRIDENTKKEIIENV